MANIQFSNFTVELIGGNNSVYANGRQQVLVNVRFTKTVDRVPTRLTNDELRSLRLVERRGTSLPNNWRQDERRSIYDHGLFRSLGYDEGKIDLINLPDNVVEGDEQFTQMSEVPLIQVVTLYISATLPAQSREFMATVVLDGLRRFNSDADFGTDPTQAFNSSVQLISRPPYTLAPSELNLTTEHAHWRSQWPGHNAEVWISYWMLPSPLRIMSDRTTRRADGGRHQWPGLSFFFDNHRRMSARIDHSVVRLTAGDIRPFPPYDWHRVGLKNLGNCIRALLDYNSYGAFNHRFDGVENFFIIDNFGCEHRFTLRQQGNNTLVLGAGNSSD